MLTRAHVESVHSLTEFALSFGSTTAVFDPPQFKPEKESDAIASVFEVKAALVSLPSAIPSFRGSVMGSRSGLAI